MTTELIGGHGYARRDYVMDYVKSRRFPDIHQDIGDTLARVDPSQRGGLMDLGACTGLLCLKAKSLGFFPIVGVEANVKDVQVFEDHLAEPNVRMFTRYFDPSKVEDRRWMAWAIRDNTVTTVMARRALPEILGDTGDRTSFAECAVKGSAFGAMLVANGVRHLVIEGRQKSARAVHALYDVEREIEAMSEYYRPTARYNQCAILVPK